VDLQSLSAFLKTGEGIKAVNDGAACIARALRIAEELSYGEHKSRNQQRSPV